MRYTVIQNGKKSLLVILNCMQDNNTSHLWELEMEQ